MNPDSADYATEREIAVRDETMTDEPTVVRECECGEEATVHVVASYPTLEGVAVIVHDAQQCDGCGEWTRKRYDAICYDVTVTAIEAAS